MEFKSIRNDKGMSLMSVIVAGAMAAGIGLYLAKSQYQAIKTAKYTQSKISLNQSFDAITRSLLKNDLCSDILKGQKSGYSFTEEDAEEIGLPLNQKVPGTNLTTQAIILTSDVKSGKASFAIKATFVKDQNKDLLGSKTITKVFPLSLNMTSEGTVSSCQSDVGNAIESATKNSCSQIGGELVKTTIKTIRVKNFMNYIWPKRASRDKAECPNITKCPSKRFPKLISLQRRSKNSLYCNAICGSETGEPLCVLSAETKEDIVKEAMSNNQLTVALYKTSDGTISTEPSETKIVENRKNYYCNCYKPECPKGWITIKSWCSRGSRKRRCSFKRTKNGKTLCQLQRPIIGNLIQQLSYEGDKKNTDTSIKISFKKYFCKSETVVNSEGKSEEVLNWQEAVDPTTKKPIHCTQAELVSSHDCESEARTSTKVEDGIEYTSTRCCSKVPTGTCSK